MSNQIHISENAAKLVSHQFILECVSSAESKSTAGARIHQHHYHFTLNGKEETIVVTLGKGIATSVMLPFEADELRKAIEAVSKDKRAKPTVPLPPTKPETIKEWCAFIETTRKTHPLTDSQLAEAICLEGEKPEDLLAMIQKVNLYIQLRDDLKSASNNIDAEGLAAHMCDKPVMAAAFLNSKPSRRT